MKTKEIVVTEREIDIDIKDITLLSLEEYKMCEDIIPSIDDWWYLRSPDTRTGAVYGVAGPNIYGLSVRFNSIAVRPVLIYESSNFQIGNKIIFAEYTWTIIGHNMALCDEALIKTCFREDGDADNCNDYEASDIKEWLHNWLKDQIKN